MEELLFRNLPCNHGLEGLLEAVCIPVILVLVVVLVGFVIGMFGNR